MERKFKIGKNIAWRKYVVAFGNRLISLGRAIKCFGYGIEREDA